MRTSASVALVLSFVCALATTAERRREEQAEMVRTLADGPGIVVIKRAFAALTVVDRATEVFNALIADQRAVGATAGDHFGMGDVPMLSVRRLVFAGALLAVVPLAAVVGAPRLDEAIPPLTLLNVANCSVPLATAVAPE